MSRAAARAKSLPVFAHIVFIVAVHALSALWAGCYFRPEVLMVWMTFFL